jgi:two-component system chemotaxis response regulator CheB
MAPEHIVVVGGSAGALEQALAMARGLPADFPAALFLVIHFPSTARSVLPDLLARSGPLPAAHASDGEAIRPGRIYVAPPDSHLVLSGQRLRLDRGPKENGHRPAIDPLFRSAAESFGSRVIGVILSGNLSDGTAGLQAIRRRGGRALVVDPELVVHDSMPRHAINRVPVSRVVAPDQIAAAISELIAEPWKEVAPVTESPAMHASEAEVVQRDRERNPGIPSTYACPECHGTLWELQDGDVLSFRCRIGHAFAADALVAEADEALEAALWTALRALEEHGALARRMAANALDHDRQRSARLFREKAEKAEQHAAVLRNLLLTAPAPWEVDSATLIQTEGA